MPQLSVLMPVRDGARWIAEAVGSVLAQTFRDFELIIIDDGSVDGRSSIRIRCGAVTSPPAMPRYRQPELH